MARLSKFYNDYKALVQLGIQPVALNALYRLGLATGHYRRVQRRVGLEENVVLRPLFNFPAAEDLLSVIGENGKTTLLSEADEIVAGQVRLFGSQPVPLPLTFSEPLRHWTEYENRPSLLATLYAPFPDVKFIWEPARFGWAFCLGRAYHLTHQEKYAETFWRNFEIFYRWKSVLSGPQLDLRAGSRLATDGLCMGCADLRRSIQQHVGAKLCSGALGCIPRFTYNPHAGLCPITAK